MHLELTPKYVNYPFSLSSSPPPAITVAFELLDLEGHVIPLKFARWLRYGWEGLGMR